MGIAPFDSQQYNACPEAVSIRSVRPNSSDVVTAVANAAVYQGTAREAAPSFGVSVATDLVMTIATDAVAFEPKPRDEVTYGGVIYRVLTVGGSQWMKFYILGVRNLSLAADLRSVGILYRPVPTTSPGGKRIPNLAAQTSNIQCRVQGIDGAAVQWASGRVMAGRYTGILGQTIIPQVGDVFDVDAGRAKYTVEGWHDPERIDSLMTLDLLAVDGATT